MVMLAVSTAQPEPPAVPWSMDQSAMGIGGYCNAYSAADWPRYAVAENTHLIASHVTGMQPLLVALKCGLLCS
jgi:hypothetical protein